MERETRIELATPTLARLCSTAELFPLFYILNKIFSVLPQARFVSESFAAILGAASQFFLTPWTDYNAPSFRVVPVCPFGLALRAFANPLSYSRFLRFKQNLLILCCRPATCSQDPVNKAIFPGSPAFARDDNCKAKRRLLLLFSL